VRNTGTDFKFLKVQGLSRAGRAGVRVPVGLRTFTSASIPERLWGPLSFLSNGYGGGTLSLGVRPSGLYLFTFYVHHHGHSHTCRH
jgi:hypothetical protein